MLYQTERFYDPGLFDDDPRRKVSSVGVLVVTGELRSGRGSFGVLFVEQEDQWQEIRDGSSVHPWGIPAGRVEENENVPWETALREVKEETGLAVARKDLRPFIVLDSGDNHVAVVYSCRVNLRQMWNLGDWMRVESGVEVLDRGGNEISRLALIDRRHLFDRGSTVLRAYYRWDFLHDIKARLEGLRII